MTSTAPQRWPALRAQLQHFSDDWAAPLAELQADPAAFTPLLLTELEALVANPDSAADDPDYALHFPVLSLLAQWRSAAAWPLALQLLSLDEDQETALLGMDAGAWLARVFASLCPDDPAGVGQLRAYIADPAISRWLRLSAFQALQIRHGAGLMDSDSLREQTRALLTAERSHQLAQPFEARDNVLTTAFTGALAELADEAAEPLLADLFAEGLVDPRAHGREDALRAMMQSGSPKLDADHGQLIDDAASALQQLEAFRDAPPEALRPLIPLGGREPIVREAPKVGRNDPCPCGSGKKYKKCCGAS